jgi:hypothetical protein
MGRGMQASNGARPDATQLNELSLRREVISDQKL